MSTEIATNPAYRVAPTRQGDDVVGILCKGCNRAVTQEEWHSSASAHLPCSGCGQELTFFDCTVDDDVAELCVVPSDADLNDPADVAKAINSRAWVHITMHRNWLGNDYEDYDDEVHYAHVGSLETVLDLYRQQYAGLEMTLYIVKVDTSANLKPGPAIDDAVNGWSEVMKWAVDGADVVRYVNAYEHPGAVSLVAKADALTRVKSMTFTGEDELRDAYAMLTKPKNFLRSALDKVKSAL